MHLYIGVCLRRLGSDRWQAEAPDLPGVHATGHSSGEALARVRLAMEGSIAGRLRRGAALPQRRSLPQLQADGELGGRYHEVHINPRQLEALARHQQGRWHTDHI